MLEVNGNYGTLDRMGSGNFVQCQLRDQMVISPIGFSQRANCCAQLPQHRNSLVLLPHLSFKFSPPPTQQASQSTRLASLSAEEWHATSMVLRHGVGCHTSWCQNYTWLPHGLSRDPRLPDLFISRTRQATSLKQHNPERSSRG